MISAALTGYFTAFSLILAIGGQNAFVLRQGLIRQHVFILCLLCAVSDAILIGLGVVGFDYLVTQNPALPMIMSLAGAAFLVVYGLFRFRAALHGDYALELSGDGTGLWATLAVGLGLTWLNPHVYLDTLGLIGAVSTQFSAASEKIVFGVAAASASFSFFFALGYGARALAPIMQTTRAWRILDMLIGIIMWALALGLTLSVL